jgi:hypothetical protein
MADHKTNYPIPKTEQAFTFRTHNFKDILKKTTVDMRENLWKNCLNFDIDLSCLQGLDGTMDKPLEELKNKHLVYSSILHFLGRSIFCSRQVHEKYTLLLKKRIKDIQTESKCDLTSISDNIDDILMPYKKVSSDFYKWSNEPILWSDYLKEVCVKEEICSKLREKCTKYDLSDSADFFVDFLAHLHLDNYFFKTMKKGQTNTMFVAERSFRWTFPMNIEIRQTQRRELQGHRRDLVMTKNHKAHKFIRIEYKNIDRDLDPYMHGGHFRALFSNEINALEYYIKNHPGKQFITEVAYLMFGVEVQKNPAALMYNMMIIDLIDGDKISQRTIYYSYEPDFPKERGGGGALPCSFHGHTTAARWLNLYYSFVFDHWYSYDIQDENEDKVLENILNPNSEYNLKREHGIRIEELMKREYDLINRWLEFKKERDRKARYLKTIQELYNYILSKTFEFYEDYKINFK